MARVREEYWVPRLRKLAKKVIKSCWGCRCFQLAGALTVPPPGQGATSQSSRVLRCEAKKPSKDVKLDEDDS
jgi:hypothetical protein